eukprot:COSAG01_NODE_7247_length_3283_cov_404.497173_3_plen_69_part_00
MLMPQNRLVPSNDCEMTPYQGFLLLQQSLLPSAKIWSSTAPCTISTVLLFQQSLLLHTIIRGVGAVVV